MPELPVTDEQLRRLESVCSDLEAAYVGPYGRVDPDDALEYLLDTYTPPEEAAEAETAGAEEETDGAAESGTGTSESESESADGIDTADLTAIEGVGEVTASALLEAGFDSPAAIEAADPEALTAAEGVGEKQAVDIVAAAAAMDAPAAEADADEGADVETDAGAGSDGASGTGPGADDRANDSPEDTLQQAMSLLDAHDDRWRESSGDEPYEVDLPDGSTEAVRTKDDVKRLLFKHWR
ncbi:helix-hairpin-helix domain-containing protein [Natronomonas salina]|uniref:helix-hairpin-helix domain-containing protein n=1 Tax=Natronomonas salina TaxID=1710540 RepID=UPI0015B6877F|nr:helix-hairpin-helix domain-containing protein [Natronomonas salina]QLD89400.1 helix-hairpin-helix domain-containing protein [Natronomonas salina]